MPVRPFNRKPVQPHVSIWKFNLSCSLWAHPTPRKTSHEEKSHLHRRFGSASGWKWGWDLTQRGLSSQATVGPDVLYVQMHVSGCQLLAERTGTAAGCGCWVGAGAKETWGGEVVVWPVATEKLLTQCAWRESEQRCLMWNSTTHLSAVEIRCVKSNNQSLLIFIFFT